MASPHTIRRLQGGATLVTSAMPERLSASLVLLFAGCIGVALLYLHFQ